MTGYVERSFLCSARRFAAQLFRAAVWHKCKERSTEWYHEFPCDVERRKAHFSRRDNWKRKQVRANVSIVFSAPNKLLKQVNLLNKPEKRKRNVKSSTAPGCTEGTVYFIPLSCGRQYIGRAEQCLNDRLREHRVTF